MDVKREITVSEFENIIHPCSLILNNIMAVAFVLGEDGNLNKNDKNIITDNITNIKEWMMDVRDEMLNSIQKKMWSTPLDRKFDREPVWDTSRLTEYLNTEWIRARNNFARPVDEVVGDLMVRFHVSGVEARPTRDCVEMFIDYCFKIIRMIP